MASERSERTMPGFGNIGSNEAGVAIRSAAVITKIVPFFDTGHCYLCV